MKNTKQKFLNTKGGYVNDPADPGGATNKGIIFRTFKKWANSDLGIEPTLGNLQNLIGLIAGDLTG